MSIILASLIFAVTLSLLPMCQDGAEEEETIRLVGCKPGEGCKKHMKVEAKGKIGEVKGKGKLEVVDRR